MSIRLIFAIYVAFICLGVRVLKLLVSVDHLGKEIENVSKIFCKRNCHFLQQMNWVLEVSAAALDFSLRGVADAVEQNKGMVSVSCEQVDCMVGVPLRFVDFFESELEVAVVVGGCAGVIYFLSCKDARSADKFNFNFLADMDGGVAETFE
jgi:hypothetical protein